MGVPVIRSGNVVSFNSVIVGAFLSFWWINHTLETEKYGDKQEEWDGKNCKSYSNPYFPHDDC